MVQLHARVLPQYVEYLIRRGETNMEERSKTNREIYEQKYPTEQTEQNCMKCAEAIGYLKALKEYFPSEHGWVDTEIAKLMLIVLINLP